MLVDVSVYMYVDKFVDSESIDFVDALICVYHVNKYINKKEKNREKVHKTT